MMVDKAVYKTRTERPLNLLTSQFVNLIRNSENGVLDIKTAMEKLELDKRRRLYDITGVLEGAGLVKKLGCSRIKWIGPECDIDEVDTKMISLNTEVHILKEKVFHLDQSLKATQNQMKATEGENETIVEFEQSHNNFNNLETLFEIEATTANNLNFTQGPSEERSYQAFLMSEDLPTGDLSSFTQNEEMLPPNVEILNNNNAEVFQDETTLFHDQTFQPTNASQINPYSSASYLDNDSNLTNFLM